ncbi:MAG: hypothetical protein JWM55_225 [Acidimicrobiaceae bacterium]|nr:hypothetical protein [Acidimicrobiaceae bacterium]
MDGDTFASILEWGVPVLIVGNLGLWLFRTIFRAGD